MSTNPTAHPAKKRSKPARRIPSQRKKLAGVSITVQRCRDPRYAARVVVRSKGKRNTRHFETLEEAKAFAQRQEVEAGNAGARAVTEIQDGERRLLLDASDALAPYGKTLADAVQFYLAHLKTTARSATVTELVDALLELKRTEKKSHRYLLDLNSRLGIFSRQFGDTPIGSITADSVSQWLAGLNLEPVGSNNFRRVLAVLFNFAAARGYCAEGVMRRTPRIKVVAEEPQILTVAECAAMLNASAPSIRAWLALGLFSGIRDAELKRLDWRDVDLEGGTIVVGASVSKLSQRRTIPIQPNLAAWLEPVRQLGGKILPGKREPRTLIDSAKRAAGFGNEAACAEDVSLRPWPINALRHSYASYKLAKWPDAAALALEMGNSPGVILRHYRSLVKPAAADAFWSLAPSNIEAENVTKMPKARARQPA